MDDKPKTGFWLLTVLMATGLIVFALYRADLLFNEKSPSDGKTQSAATGAPPTPANKLEITFYSSSAKKQWVDEMVKVYNAKQDKVGDRTVQVKAFHVNSGESLDQLKAGQIQPDLWSPGDESWLELAAAHWRDVKGAELFDKYVPLVNIPLVIAIWEPMAKALGHPKPLGWADIAKVATDAKGWASVGHPEWGKFRWGHAHPDANSGFLTVISIIYAAGNKTEGLTVEDLKKPQTAAFLKKFEESVAHYGLSNSWIDELMHKKGPAYLSATVQYENTIIESNTKYNNKPFKMLAVYPTEGTFWTRHPVAVMQEAWMTPEKQAAAEKFVEFLLSRKSQEKAMEMGLRPIQTDIALAAPFDEAHGVQLNVDAARAFQVPEEAILKRIRDLWEDVKIPATIAMIIDRSGSMNGPPMDNAKVGAAEFIKAMKPRDQLKLVVFNKDVATILPKCAIRECGESAQEKIQGVFAEGATALHDALMENYQNLKELEQRDPSRRYALMLLSDGKDTASRVGRQDFLDSLPKGEDFDAPKIYTIAYGEAADTDLLAEIANRTNGRLFKATVGNIVQTYKELSANF